MAVAQAEMTQTPRPNETAMSESKTDSVAAVMRSKGRDGGWLVTFAVINLSCCPNTNLVTFAIPAHAGVRPRHDGREVCVRWGSAGGECTLIRCALIGHFSHEYDRVLPMECLSCTQSTRVRPKQTRLMPRSITFAACDAGRGRPEKQGL